MSRHLTVSGAIVALGAGLALAACGSSSTSGTSSSPGASSSSSISVGGGSFCDQTRSVIAQVTQLSKSLVPSPGATPNAESFKQLLATITSAVDALDGSAPGEIASAFHTFRAAYDQANSRVQAATTFAEMGNAFSGIDQTSITTARDQIGSYLKTACGINPSATP